MAFTDYRKVFVFKLLVIENTVFFSIKHLMDRQYLPSLFELSMISQGLGNTVFRAVYHILSIYA